MSRNSKPALKLFWVEDTDGQFVALIRAATPKQAAECVAGGDEDIQCGEVLVRSMLEPENGQAGWVVQTTTVVRYSLYGRVKRLPDVIEDQ